MPRGPQGQKRPADVIGNAIMIAKIATGEIQGDISRPNKTRANGGLVRSERLTPTRRSEIAKSAAEARWADRKVLND